MSERMATRLGSEVEDRLFKVWNNLNGFANNEHSIMTLHQMYSLHPSTYPDQPLIEYQRKELTEKYKQYLTELSSLGKPGIFRTNAPFFS